MVMTKDEQNEKMLHALKQIAEQTNPHIYGALFQLIAKQTIQDVGGK
jgi:hypothetical protein